MTVILGVTCNLPLCCTTNKNIRLCDPFSTYSAVEVWSPLEKKQQRTSTSLLRALSMGKAQLL